MNQVLDITQAAALYFQPRLSNEQRWIRISVKNTGCSGYQYDISPCAEPLDNDIIETHHDLAVCIEKKSAPILVGTTIDLQKLSAGQQKITFDNPSAQDYCGCGVSFSLKEDL